MKSLQGMTRKLTAIGAFLVLTGVLQSCFTGVEGTSKISLSKKEMTAVAPTQEDLFLADIVPSQLKDWKRGMPFLVTDDKFRLIIENYGGARVSEGDTVRFQSAESRYGADGSEQTVLLFEESGNHFAYIIEKDPQSSSEQFKASDIPMLISLDVVEAANSKMQGKKFWTRTALWYGDSTEYIKGRKFVAVNVDEVGPGNAFFPLFVKFHDEEGKEGRLLMNIGSAGNDSRNFGKLFSLTDPRNNYKNLTEENWRAIQAEDVRLGMTKEECRLSRGNPSDVDLGHNYSNAMEIWYYPNGSYLRFVDGLLVSFKN